MCATWCEYHSLRRRINKSNKSRLIENRSCKELGYFDNCTAKIAMDIETDGEVSKETLKKFFGFDDFLNDFQEYICRRVLEGTNDVYLNLQPGDGKSLCFQLPTVLKSHKLSVVFVPIHILAMDQISFLQQRGIIVNYVFTISSKEKLGVTIRDFKSKKTNKLQFLYVFVQKGTMDFIKDCIVKLNAQNALSYIVFDEAHCVSTLSHNYIPAYRDAAELVRETCPNVCKIALTATATAEVRRDIISQLSMKNVAKFRPDRNRKTVYYDVYFIDAIIKPLDHLTEFLNKRFDETGHSLSQVSQICGIIFCRKREVVCTIAEYLRSKNILATEYHGALLLHVRESIRKKWANGEIRVIVATHPFGIGLHRPDVRFVVHWNLPLSFQQMYQESGRVSRDGEISYCRVYYSYYEEESITTYLKCLSTQSGKNIEAVVRKLKFFEAVVNYCLEIKCRHVARSKYFGEIVAPCGKLCDACTDVKKLRNRVTACLEYRASAKKKTADKSSYEKLKALTPAHMERLYIGDGLPRNERHEPLNQLIHELMENYKENRQKVEKNVSEFDVIAIALRLEYSLHAVDDGKKYNHHIVLAIHNIRRATQSGSACIHFAAQEKPVFDPEPNVIADPKPVTIDEIITID